MGGSSLNLILKRWDHVWAGVPGPETGPEGRNNSAVQNLPGMQCRSEPEVPRHRLQAASSMTHSGSAFRSIPMQPRCLSTVILRFVHVCIVITSNKEAHQAAFSGVLWTGKLNQTVSFSDTLTRALLHSWHDDRCLCMRITVHSLCSCCQGLRGS